MDKNVFDISGIVGQIKEELTAKEIEKKASVLGGMTEKVAGKSLEKTASEANSTAVELEAETGRKLELSSELEKIASDMEHAESVDEIIKIAEEYGNSDIGNLAVLARSIADVVVEDISERLSDKQ